MIMAPEREIEVGDTQMPTKDENLEGKQQTNQPNESSTTTNSQRPIQVTDAMQSMSSKDEVASTDDSAKNISNQSLYMLSAFTSLTSSFSADGAQAVKYALVDSKVKHTEVEKTIDSFTVERKVVLRPVPTTADQARIDEIAAARQKLLSMLEWLNAIKSKGHGKFLSENWSSMQTTTTNVLPDDYPDTFIIGSSLQHERLYAMAAWVVDNPERMEELTKMISDGGGVSNKNVDDAKAKISTENTALRDEKNALLTNEGDSGELRFEDSPMRGSPILWGDDGVGPRLSLIGSVE